MANENRPGGDGRRPYLKIENVTKNFGDFTALRNISLEVYESEFVCFLGPSGCGKTTLLRAVAGLDIQTAGRIEQGGKDISDLPVSHRDFGIVFQSYALFPNLSVYKNVAYGLENRKMPRADIQARVAELLDLVGMSAHVKKFPAQLSGGEQQRIALARALATSPGLLLLDEPLSALDAKVRVHLRHEVKQLQHQLGVTTIMVTHDQEEGLTMADRIVVMNHGVIEQVGTPQEIYGVPASPFVADFVGTMNFLSGTAAGGGRVQIGGFQLAVENGSADFAEGTPLTFCMRPEDVVTRGIGSDAGNAIETTVTGLEFLGSFYRASLAVKGSDDTTFRADLSVNLVRERDIGEGQALTVVFPEDRFRVFSTS